MPSIRAPHPGRPRRPGRPRGSTRGGQAAARIVVLGDLMVDVVLAPSRALERGTDVPGRVRLVQGGSAANTARWLGRLGATASLIGAVGRDAAGRALVDALRSDHVTARIVRVASVRTGRIGVLVTPDGERSFVADRGAADELRPDDLKPAWFAGADALHLPAYSLLGEPLGRAGLAAVELGRQAGALISVDLSSVGPLLAGGRKAARALIESVRPDLVFATTDEMAALIGRGGAQRLLDLTPLAVVKRGAMGATVVLRDGDRTVRFEVATEHRATADSTGAGDAFDAGFLVAWLAARSAGRTPAAAAQRAALAGHRAASRQLTVTRSELPLG